MKRQKRPFQKNALNHCYQRTVDGGVLFYNYGDYLVWFTIVCMVARKHQVTIVALCPMPDHTHFSVIAASLKQLSGFFREYTSLFTAEHNPVCNRTGPLFESPYGSVPYYTEKKARTNIIYVANNPVERKLAEKAEDYRWTFLAYAVSNHPFSRQLVIRDARWPLQQAVKEVKAEFQAGRHLHYAQIKRLFKPLDAGERQQLTDYIISVYNVLDYGKAVSYFKSYEDMLLAMQSTTGSEHILKETFVGKSDAHYTGMTATIIGELHPEDIHDVLGYPLDKKYEVFQLLRRNSFALSEQIAKYLHMPLKKSIEDFAPSPVAGPGVAGEPSNGSD